jgi:hypothetical protein
MPKGFYKKDIFSKNLLLPKHRVLLEEFILNHVSEENIFNRYVTGKDIIVGKPFQRPFLVTPVEGQECVINRVSDFNVTDRLILTDHSDREKYTCFEFVARINKESYDEGLLRICKNWKLDISHMKEIKYYLDVKTKEVSFSETERIIMRSFNFKEVEYWQQYGIRLKTLYKYKVTGLVSFSFVSNKYGPKTVPSTIDNPIFCYYHNGGAKLYSPKANKKGYRFRFLGKRAVDYVFGKEQLPETGDLLIITGGEKDTLTLSGMAYNAISLNSENSTLKQPLYDELSKRFKEIVICYDNDKTGLDRSAEIANTYGLRYIILPEMLDDDSPNVRVGKDISDFIKLGNTKEDFQKLLNKVLAAPAPEAKKQNIPWPENKANKEKTLHSVPKPFPINSELRLQVMDCIQQIIESKKDITSDQKDWAVTGLSLVPFGDEAIELFNIVSQFYPKYNREECDKKFAQLQKGWDGRANPKTFLKLCEKAGIRPRLSVKLNHTKVDTIASNKFDDALDILQSSHSLRFNEITQYIEDNGKKLEEMELNSLYIDLVRRYGNYYKSDFDILLNSRDIPSYNPLKDFIAKNQDTIYTGNIENLAKSLNTTEGHEYTYFFLKKWLIGLVAGIFDKNYNELMIVLAGKKNIGKTWFCRNLLPKELNEIYFAQSDFSAGKDDSIKMCENLLVFYDELEQA